MRRWRALRHIAQELGVGVRRPGGAFRLDGNLGTTLWSDGVVTLRHIWSMAPRVDDDPRPAPSVTRDRLRKAADAIATANRLVAGLTLGEKIALMVAMDRNGCRVIPEYSTDLAKAPLADLAEAAEDAASRAKKKVTTGPRTNKEINEFVHCLIEYFECWRGERPTLTKKDCSSEPYSGTFFDLVETCLGSRGIVRTNPALGGVIERALYPQIRRAKPPN